MPTSIDCKAMGEAQTPLGLTAARYEAGALLCGKYRLEVLLGEGGMGSVWRACNELLDLTVAIKLIRADLELGALRARLQLEARAAAKIGHPAIVRVYDVGESELGDPFIVMEYLRGETLGQLLAAGRIPATRAVQLLLPIIDALAVAHARGIVHRDLKPDNLMIAREEQHLCPKILDFGVAKLTDSGDSEHQLTEIGAVVGSPEYMSPEQACGRDDVDARTDIWSMCVVLYEAVTGCPPFTASNYHALLRSIVDDAPKPLSEHAAADDKLWQIVERGLRKDRTQRYSEISELGQALASWLVSHGVAEDACGSSLDSKWLSRSCHALALAEAESGSVPSKESQARRRHDSIPDNTGIARGPFSATIRPVASGRTLTLGAAVAGCAVLAVAWLALGHSSNVPTTTTRSPAAAVVSAATLAPGPKPAAVPELPAAGAQTNIEVWPVSSTQPERDAKPVVPVAHAVKPAWNGVRAHAVTNTAASSAPSAAPRPDRPLDLLSPY